MNERQEIRMVKSDREIAVEVITSLAGLALMYLALNPSAIDNLREWAYRQVDSLANALSIWSARRSIRSLPEIDE